MNTVKPIALGADHGGYALKEAIKQHLESQGIPCQDFGTFSEESVDYPVWRRLSGVNSELMSMCYARWL